MASPNVSSWIEENQTLAVTFAFALLVLYVAPVYIIGLSPGLPVDFRKVTSGLFGLPRS